MSVEIGFARARYWRQGAADSMKLCGCKIIPEVYPWLRSLPFRDRIAPQTSP